MPETTFEIDAESTRRDSKIRLKVQHKKRQWICDLEKDKAANTDEIPAGMGRNRDGMILQNTTHLINLV